MIATWAIAAPSETEAHDLALPSRMMFAHLLRGELIPVPSVEKARQWASGRDAPSRNRRSTLGTPGQVKAELDEVAEFYGADELMLVNIMSDHSARVRSYELLAAQYGLAPLAKAA